MTPLADAPTTAALQTFLRRLAHDLRRPVRHVVSFAEILWEEEAAALSEDGRMALDTIMRAGSDLSQMLEGLLRLAQVESDHRPAPAVRVDEVIEEARRLVQGDLGVDLTVTVPALPVVPGDPAQLRWLFGELLTNAVRAAAPAPATITITAEPGGDDHLRVAVGDDGPGIPADEADLVLEAFTRASTSVPGEGLLSTGPGIGLTIARAIAQRHGGALGVRPVTGGACIVIDLPRSGEDEATR